MTEEMRDHASGRWWRPRSLHGRVFGALLVAGLLPVLLLGTYSFFSERRRAVALELSRLSDQSQRLAAAIDKFLASNSATVQHMALTSEVASFLTEKATESRISAMNAWLKAHCALDQDLDAILLIRPDGLCVASSESRYLGANYAFRTYFQDAMAGHCRYTDMQIGMRIPEPFISISKAVTRQGEVVGVITFRISMTKVQQEVASRSAKGKIAYLINRDGIFLAHTHPDFLYSAIAPIPPQRLQEIEASRQFMGRSHPVLVKLSPDSINTVFQVLSTGQHMEARYTNAGVVRWVSLRRLEGEPWVVGVAVNESEILSHSNHILLLTSLLCLLSVLLVVPGGFWFSKKVLGPLGKLKRAMDRFGKGDSAARAPEDGQGEVGLLGRQFNIMADTIQEQTEALAKRVDTLEGILPICASCRKIRNEEGVYEPVESYISTRSGATFTHGLCEDCARDLYPELYGPDGKRKSVSRNSGKT